MAWKAQTPECSRILKRSSNNSIESDHISDTHSKGSCKAGTLDVVHIPDLNVMAAGIVLEQIHSDIHDWFQIETASSWMVDGGLNLVVVLALVYEYVTSMLA